MTEKKIKINKRWKILPVCLAISTQVGIGNVSKYWNLADKHLGTQVNKTPLFRHRIMYTLVIFTLGSVTIHGFILCDIIFISYSYSSKSQQKVLF